MDAVADALCGAAHGERHPQPRQLPQWLSMLPSPSIGCPRVAEMSGERHRGGRSVCGSNHPGAADPLAFIAVWVRPPEGTRLSHSHYQPYTRLDLPRGSLKLATSSLDEGSCRCPWTQAYLHPWLSPANGTTVFPMRSPPADQHVHIVESPRIDKLPACSVRAVKVTRVEYTQRLASALILLPEPRHRSSLLRRHAAERIAQIDAAPFQQVRPHVVINQRGERH
jgi:hypothetical protein